MSPPPIYTEEELYEMSREELVDYAYNRQQAAYEGWEENMGPNL